MRRALFLLVFAPLVSPTGEDLLALSGVRAGVVVHLGTTDGALEVDLAKDGKTLVHGLSLSEPALQKAREALRAKGLYGLATVEMKTSFGTLPYADNLVNLLVAEPNLPDFSVKEALRVLAPSGVLLEKKGASWTKTVKPRPKEMDDWTHFDYGPEGNGVSRDALVRPCTQVQWASGAQPIKLGGNPAAYRVYTGFRVAEGRAFYEWTTAKDKTAKGASYYGARDAWNGVPLWNIEDGTGMARKEWDFVATRGLVFAFLARGGPLVALDGATGAVVRSYTEGGRLTDEPGLTALRVLGDTIVQSAGDSIYALDLTKGTLKWKRTFENRLALFPSVSAKEGKVFSVIAEDRKSGTFGRWPVIHAMSIVSLDLSTGKDVWTNAEVAGGEIGQLVYADGSLGIFGSGAIGGGKDPYLGRIDAATGKLLWHTTFKTAYNRFGYNLLIRDGTMYYADAWRIYALDWKTGAETRPFDDGGYNMRCNRFSATENYLIYGYVTYVDKSWTGEYQSITRGGCAQGSVPAGGLMYFTPQACGCFTMLRGHLALSAEPLREPLPDARRREAGSGSREAVPSKVPPPPGPLAEDWTRSEKGARVETEPVAAEGRTYVGLTHEQRVEARDAAGKALWSFTAGGRVSGAPLLEGGLCIFGSHDGWVYALKAADGTLAWRFLAAPYERKVVVDSQLESSWPVYGVVLHEGLVCFSAGLHPEVGGGISVYGVDPKSGTLRWKKVLRKGPVKVEAKNRSPITPNRILNDALASDGKLLSLPGITFDPRTTDDELRTKIEAPTPKKK